MDKITFPDRLWIGIDPGRSGGCVAIDDIMKVISYTRNDITRMDLWQWFNDLPIGPRMRRYCFIEKVGGFMGDEDSSEDGKRNRASAHTMFTFGQSYGELLMCLVGHHIPYEEITPRAWQKAVGVVRRAEEKRTAHKARLKQKAQSLFPSEKITLATSDAFLLAWYCRMMHGGR
jgi:hypothetical protein